LTRIHRSTHSKRERERKEEREREDGRRRRDSFQSNIRILNMIGNQKEKKKRCEI